MTSQKKKLKANAIQVGGNHYLKMKIQPWEAMRAWLTPEEYRGYHKGVVIAYLAREADKGKDQDIEKSSHHMLELVDYLNELKSKK
jgi:hypothetical protein